jgi:hypothetical protein
MKHIAILVLVSLLACSSTSATGTGSLAFTTWGEEYIEQEIPVTSEGKTIVADGWSIKYAKFLVVIGNIKVQDASGGVAFELRGTKLVDHTKVGRKTLVSVPNVAAKAWSRVSYEIPTIDSNTELAGASDADKALMIKGGYSIYIEGSASKGAVTKSYKWGFQTATLFDRCKAQKQEGKDEVEGVVVKTGITDSIELTIHGDHFYYDDLQSVDAVVRFDNIAAADTNNDTEVTLDELSRVKLAAIPTEKGKYGTGSASGIADLGAFVAALSRTIGHYRGEGECIASAKK